MGIESVGTEPLEVRVPDDLLDSIGVGAKLPRSCGTSSRVDYDQVGERDRELRPPTVSAGLEGVDENVCPPRRDDERRGIDQRGPVAIRQQIVSVNDLDAKAAGESV